MAESQSSAEIIEIVCPKYAEIVVIRHGETEWNADRRIQGQLDIALNGIGRQQAFALAERLSRESKVDVVYSSDLKRAFETAQMIAESCGVLEVVSDPDLRERHLGDLQGVLFDEAAKINPEAYRAFRSNRNDLEIPGGGESYDQLHNRCTLALQRIAMKHIGERVVVVSHGTTIEALYTRACSSEDCRGKIPNASINVFRLFDDHDKWTVISWGDVSHLRN
ncbi:Phosphoglycerate mutase family protein [Perilla frutescens var. hirtella]|nr:Phosphoglycerate mutase family protein [Perilla frutescens var. hirtella]